MDKLPIMRAKVDLTESAQDLDDSADVFFHSHSLSVEPVMNRARATLLDSG